MTRGLQQDVRERPALCEGRGEPYLPAEPKTIWAFIDDCAKEGKKPATIKRYVATIARVPAAAGLLNPCSERSPMT